MKIFKSYDRQWVNLMSRICERWRNRSSVCIYSRTWSSLEELYRFLPKNVWCQPLNQNSGTHPMDTDSMNEVWSVIWNTNWCGYQYQTRIGCVYVCMCIKIFNKQMKSHATTQAPADLSYAFDIKFVMLLCNMHLRTWTPIQRYIRTSVAVKINLSILCLVWKPLLSLFLSQRHLRALLASIWRMPSICNPSVLVLMKPLCKIFGILVGLSMQPPIIVMIFTSRILIRKN